MGGTGYKYKIIAMDRQTTSVKDIGKSRLLSMGQERRVRWGQDHKHTKHINGDIPTGDSVAGESAQRDWPTTLSQKNEIGTMATTHRVDGEANSALNAELATPALKGLSSLKQNCEQGQGGEPPKPGPEGPKRTCPKIENAAVVPEAGSTAAGRKKADAKRIKMASAAWAQP